ncbi:MAG: hypothetical protein ACK4F4_03125 [Hylemonella sp.]|jgi:hypothetical protein|uniref:hypothetical protein n=1 Tax=Hylemonella sp. TaxID=2066020 RepID=UPI00391A5B2D
MVRLDNLFAKKTVAKSAPVQDAGPSHPPADDEQAQDRKSMRLERRELLYAVVRESMARVGMLSSSYKYKVLSLDSRGKQYLIMMDLPREMAEHIGQLAEIEEIITQNARQRHHIEVTAVYWRINQLAKVVTSVLRKPRADVEFGAPPPVLGRVHAEAEVMSQPAPSTGERKPRFEPIRADEVHAFKQGLGAGKKPAAPAKSTADFAPTEFPSTEFEETRLEDEHERLPLSRTQYGDLI